MSDFAYPADWRVPMIRNKTSLFKRKREKGHPCISARNAAETTLRISFWFWIERIEIQ